MPQRLLQRIMVQLTGNANFARWLNQHMRPLMHNAHMRSPRGPASTLFVTGMPYAVDAWGQFSSPVYAVFCRFQNEGVADEDEERAIIAEFLLLNPTLSEYVREMSERGREVARVHGALLDDGFNLVVVHAPGSADAAHEVEVVRHGYGRANLAQHEIVYDQLVYPLIFWSGTGGCGVASGDPPQGATTMIRKCAMALVNTESEPRIWRNRPRFIPNHLRQCWRICQHYRRPVLIGGQ
jgi:hypothetical protein